MSINETITRAQINTEELIASTLLGRSDPVTRGDLVKITGVNDRSVRAAIERLRRKGLPIISSPYERGYWIAKDEGELNAFQWITAAKCTAELKTSRSMRMSAIKKWEVRINGESVRA